VQISFAWESLYKRTIVFAWVSIKPNQGDLPTTKQPQRFSRPPDRIMQAARDDRDFHAMQNTVEQPIFL
jgi:hypothetical protein